MASTYSPNLRLELITTGEQQGTWGSTTNTNLGTLLEEAIGGYISVTVTDGADTTLTTNNGSADQSRNMVINLTGALTGTRNVICPAIEKLYVVKNATTGSQSVVFKVSGQTGVTIPNGSTYFLYVDGTDARQITGSMAAQNANAVSITGGSISGATVSNSSLSNVSVVANASSLSVRDSDGSNTLSIAVGSNLTSNTVLTLTTGATSNRTLDISASNVTISTAGAALIDDADASAQRTTLGLGTISTQNANAVSITGGSIAGITDLALADGGTGASLADPNANAVLGWNDTANVMGFFTAGTGITINATSNTISSTVTSDIPVASVIPYAGTSAPTGWLLCFGQAVSRATYASLFAVVSTTYGVGDGSTTFNLPDLRGRVVAGEDDMGGTSANRLTNQSGGVDGDVLGAAGGSETHTLTTAQLAAHTHQLLGLNNTSGSARTTIASVTTGDSVNTESAGSGTAHNNVQPTFILNYIIKT
jgi:microcystin-dependent protein